MPFADLREYLNALEKAGELPELRKRWIRNLSWAPSVRLCTKRAGRRCYLIAFAAGACRW